jgi:hypothetical protein
VSRLVDEREYARVIAERKAVKDPAVDKRGGIGEVERWLTPEGEVCAWLFVRYWKGEHDYEYHVSD